MTDAALGPFEDMIQQAGRDNIPISACLELTNACNVDCEHCYLDLVPDKKIDVLSTDEWKRVLRELADEGCLFLTLTGGELLMRRDWFDIGSYARELGYALRLFTNGTMIDEAQADRIASLDPLGIEISLLGARAESHDAIARRKGAFDKTIRGVRLLRERGIHVLLKTVIMQKNVAEVAQIEALARELGCDSFFDLQISPKNNGSQAPTELSPEVTQLLAAAKKVGKADSCGHPTPFDRKSKLEAAPCAAGRATCFVGPTGNISPCTQWTTPLGNVRKKSFSEIWWGEELAKIRANRIGSFEACKSCDLLEICSPCMALSLLENGVVDGPSPTKCRNTLVKAQALGVPGYPAGLKAIPKELESGLVQLRVPRRAKVA